MAVISPFGTAALARLSRVRVLAASGQARELRVAARLSQSEIARACGVSPALVCRWELGERTPRGRAAEIYAAILLPLEEQS
jgi:transcriptional regulator with XRE-family HTH domain